MDFTHGPDSPDTVIIMRQAEVGDENVRSVITRARDGLFRSFGTLNCASHALQERLKRCTDFDFIIDAKDANTLKRDERALLNLARFLILVLCQP